MFVNDKNLCEYCGSIKTLKHFDIEYNAEVGAPEDMCKPCVRREYSEVVHKRKIKCMMKGRQEMLAATSSSRECTNIINKHNSNKYVKINKKGRGLITEFRKLVIKYKDTLSEDKTIKNYKVKIGRSLDLVTTEYEEEKVQLALDVKDFERFRYKQTENMGERAMIQTERKNNIELWTNQLKRINIILSEYSAFIDSFQEIMREGRELWT